jgi:FAD binding domain/Berberine and berberine like
MSLGNPAVSGALGELRSAMQGHVLTTGERGYDEARRIWNGSVDHHPFSIAVCETVADVQVAVRVARKHGLAVSVLGGGYDWAGRSVRDQGLVIGLSEMKRVIVDVQSQTATVQGGATAADVVAAAAEHGLTAVVGTMGKIGMVGFTLAGGYGPLSPRFGLGLDNLVAAELITPDGRLINTSAAEHPDLFWALRGGGGNFGVVTAMQIQLHPMREVLAGKILFPWSEARSVLSGFADVMKTTSDELAATAVIVSGPDGALAIALAPCWSGETERGMEVIDELKRLGSPIMANIKSMTCTELFGLFEGNAPRGRHYSQQTRWIPDITTETITNLLEIGNCKTSPFSVVAVQSFHGAPSRVPLHSTAFGLRQRHFLVGVIAGWDAAEAHDCTVHQSWAKQASALLSASALPGGYPNLLGPDERSQIAAAYGANTGRLLEMKHRVDPDGVFNATPLPMNNTVSG